MKKTILTFCSFVLMSCASNQPSTRTLASVDADTVMAEKEMKKLVMDKSSQQIVTCFDNLEIGPRYTIDIYKTNNLNLHCVGVFKDNVKKLLAYRALTNCWNDNGDTYFKGAKNNNVWQFAVQGNYGPLEIFQIESQMELKYFGLSRFYLGVIKGVPGVVDFEESGSCRLVSP